MNDIEMLKKRLYSWELVTYASENEFKYLFDDKDITHYAYIYHDKDIKEDGSLKEPHYHILLVYSRAKSFNYIKKFIKSEQNTRAIPLTRADYPERYEYLTHKNDTDKYQYDLNDIKTNNFAWWSNNNTDDNEEEIDNMLNDLINGCSFRELAKKYGRDFIKNYQSYYQYAKRVAIQEKIVSYITEDYCHIDKDTGAITYNISKNVIEDLTKL